MFKEHQIAKTHLLKEIEELKDDVEKIKKNLKLCHPKNANWCAWCDIKPMENCNTTCDNVCQPIVYHDWETAFCGCKQCKKCLKREYGYNCNNNFWTYTIPQYWNTAPLPLTNITC